MPGRIIESAKGLLGGMKIEFDNLAADLRAKRAEYEKVLQDLEKKRSELEGKERQLNRRLSELETREREALAKAYHAASEIISETKKEVHALLDEAKKKDRERQREVMKRVAAKQEEIVQKLREYDPAGHEVPAIDKIQRGDIVFVRSLGYDASVVTIDERHNRVRVKTGGKEVEVPLPDIGLRRGKSPGVTAAVAAVGKGDEVVPARINIVGLRVDEAISRLEPFLNHASLAGLSEVTIIHGFGTGVLARAVRGHLDGHPLVNRFRKGEPSEGGGGVTVATLA
jgi:DNA mismatch repair protein MutS2